MESSNPATPDAAARDVSQETTPYGDYDPGATRYFPPQPSQQPQTPEMAQPAQPPNYMPMHAVQPGWHQKHSDRDRTVLGLILVGGGLLFLLSQFPLFGDFGDLILLLLGGMFLYGYFRTRPGYRVGFLIPGAILAGIGAGQALERFSGSAIAGGDVQSLALGLGFCAIWLLERKHWWALVPGGILVMSGLGTMGIVGKLWPLGLIGLGVYMLYDQTRRKVR